MALAVLEEDRKERRPPVKLQTKNIDYDGSVIQTEKTVTLPLFSK
jgi:hypothetical protein